MLLYDIKGVYYSVKHLVFCMVCSSLAWSRCKPVRQKARTATALSYAFLDFNSDSSQPRLHMGEVPLRGADFL